MVVVINSDLTKVLLKKLYIKDSAIENCERESWLPLNSPLDQ